MIKIFTPHWFSSVSHTHLNERWLPLPLPPSLPSSFPTRSDYSQSFTIATVQAHVWPPPLGQELPLQVIGKALIEPSDDSTYQIASDGGIEGGHLCMLAQCPIAGPFSLYAEIGIPPATNSSYHSFELSARDDAASVLLFCVRVEWNA